MVSRVGMAPSKKMENRVRKGIKRDSSAKEGGRSRARFKPFMGARQMGNFGTRTKEKF
jgi:hypothetical protein